MVVFRAQKPQSDVAPVGYLRGFETIRMADPIFIMTWTAKGTIKSSIQQIHVVCEYVDVFPDELPRLLPAREVEFAIELMLGVQPISKTLIEWLLQN